MAIRALALVALLVMAQMSWKGSLLLGGMGVVALVAWYRHHL